MKNILLLVVLAVSSGVAGSDWTQWGGPDGDNISKESNFSVSAISQPEILWTSEVGNGFSSVSVQGSSLITVGHKGGMDTIYCLNSKTGKEIWKYSYENGTGGGFKGPRATPVIDEGRVYSQSCTGKMFCLDLKTGKVIWQSHFRDFDAADLKWHYSGSARVYKKLVVYNVNQYGIAVNKKTGKKVWSSPGGQGGYATPYLFKIGSKDCVALFGRETITAVDVKSGKKLWSLPWKTKYDVNSADPIVVKNHMFISSGYGTGSAMIKFSRKSAEIVWKSREMQNQFDTSVLIDKHIYGISGAANKRNSKLVCMDWKTGTVKWSNPIGGYGALSAVNNTLLILTEKKGHLIAVKASPSGYEELARKEKLLRATCWTAPVLANGVLYCRNSRGKLLALSATK